jgi:hypothetical protein
MTYRILKREEGNILVLDLEGDIIGDGSDRIHYEIIDMIRENHDRKILIDIRRFKSRLSVADKFLSVRNLPLKNITKGKVAILDNLDQEEENRFYQTTAKNVGVFLYIFHDENKAMEWLNADQS